jgi:glycosyltransferase involved in cell wall biosynthesis
MTQNQPRVTVGMPVYNDPHGLRRSVPSVVGQTWRGSLRLLIVDDGSTDETADVLASLTEMHQGIEVVRTPQNEGRPFARNRIVELAGDDYLAWCDSGDLWQPRKLELQLATLFEAERQDPGTAVLCAGPIHWVQADTGQTTIRIPDVDGDQLLNALTGKIFPHLQGLVGRATHFRQLGGFDTRLLRRQDYDFLVRFLGEGGRIVTSSRHTPVFTYIKFYGGGSPDVVARANQVIRNKHQPYYRRYGKRLERQVRSNQHRLVARFYSANESRAGSMAYRTQAWLSAPELIGPARRGVRRAWQPRRHATAAAGVLIRLLRPVLPALRRSRLADVARKAGLDHRLTRLGVQGLSSQQEGATHVPPSAPISPQNKARTEPSTWLRTEQSYREQGLLHSAESALRDGVQQHPDNEDLRMRLIELLALRGNWSECVDLWSEDQRAGGDAARALTYSRVAWAYRRLNRHADAVDVAQEGLRRWPSHRQLRDELWTNRAELVDWKQAAATPAVPESASQPTEPIGTVTALGTLGGGDGPMEGRVSVRGEGAPPVSLLVNGVPVASTAAAGGADGEWSTFAFNCAGLRAYLGDGDVISVESNGQPLAIDGDGHARRVMTGYASRFAELVQLLNAGYVFTKFGTLKERSTPETKAQTLALYNEISALLEASWGYSAFPFYGNLLGAVREHDIIAHDVGGFDMGYVSSHHEADAVRSEFIDICRTLVERGYHLRLEPWSVYVRPNRRSRVFVDVNYAWFTEAGELNLSFGWRHAPVTDRQRYFYPRESLIGRHAVRIPGNAEDVLVQIYGTSWAVPDQGFALEADLQRDPAFLLTETEMFALEQLDPDRVAARVDRSWDEG